MAETFLKLSASDRREALALAAAASGRPLHLLDKDARLRLLLRSTSPCSFLRRTPQASELITSQP